MIAIALGVLVVTAAVTAGLARRTEPTTARARLRRQRADVVAPRARPARSSSCRSARAADAPRRGVGSSGASATCVRPTLRVSDGAVVAIDADGDVAARCLGGLLGARRARRSRCPTGVTRRRPRHAGTARRRDAERARRRHRVPGRAAARTVGRHHAGGRARRAGRTAGPSARSGLRCSARPRSSLVRRRARRGLPRPPHDPPARGDGATARSIARGDLAARVDTDRRRRRRARPASPTRQRDGRASSTSRAGTSARSC